MVFASGHVCVLRTSGARFVRGLAVSLMGLAAFGVAQQSHAASCTVSTAVSTPCVLSVNGDSATVTSTGVIAITAITGDTSHAIHFNQGDTQRNLGGITIDGTITTVGTGVNNGYIVNLVKTSTPLSTLPGGITLNGSATGISRGFYINDFNVSGISIGAQGVLSTGSLAIHVVDSSVISGDVVNQGTIRSTGGTIYLGDATIVPRVTGALTNSGVVYGPIYAISTASQITGGATNTSTGRIIGEIAMPNVDFQNSGQWINKDQSDFDNPGAVGVPTVSAVRNFTQAASATLGIAVAGDVTGGGAVAGTNFSRVTANGDAVVSGALQVDVKSDFLANDSPTCTVIPGIVVATGTLAGNFSSVSGNSPDYTFESVVNGNAIDLRACHTPALALTYSGNGSDAGTAPSGAYYATDATATAAGVGTLKRAGYTFAGWNTAADGSGTAYPAGGTFTISASIVLYAQWQVAAPPEPAPVMAIPTLSTWGLALLALAAAGLGIRARRARV